MKSTLGIVLILGGIALSIYGGVWYFLIGGIVAIMNVMIHRRQCER